MDKEEFNIPLLMDVWSWEKCRSPALGIPAASQPAGLSISTPQHQHQLGMHGKGGEGKLNLVRPHGGAKVIDVSPSFQSHYSSGFILNKSHSGFRVSREDPSGDFTSHGPRKRLN